MPNKPITAQQIARLAKARAREFKVISSFKHGYRNKEDITKLPPGVLVSGSKNVLTNGADRVASRQGYILDGDAALSTDVYPVDSAFDFQTHNGRTWNLRKWNTNLEFRYEDSAGVVTWQNLMGGIAGTELVAANKVNFAPWWNQLDEFKNFLLFVNGDLNIYEWSGGVGTFASASSSAGQITAVSPNPGNTGSGYAVGDILTLGTGVGGTVRVTEIVNVGITTITITQAQTAANAAGQTFPYVVGQLLSFSCGGGTNGMVRVTSINATGGVTGVTLISTGTGFSSAGVYSNVNTFANTYAGQNPGYGDGCQLQVTIAGSNGVISKVALVTPGSGYAANITYATTTTGAGINATIATQGITDKSLTLQGTDTAAVLNFYTSNGGTLNINGVQYSYTGVLNQTFFNLSADAAAASIPVGTLVVQAPKKWPNSGMISLPKAGFTNDLIRVVNNQAYVGSLTNLTVYTSKYNNYQDFSFSSPRAVGDGFTTQLDEPPTAFEAQDNVFYVGTKQDYWYTVEIVTTVNSTGGSAQTINTNRLKTTFLQGPRSQALTTRMKNFIVYVSYETIINALGFTKNFLAVPSITNMSDSIVNDINDYDFTDGSIFYFNYYLYISVPREGIVLVYNIIKKYWEAPQTLPISRFYVVDGVLCGHSYYQPESYTLFTGYNDNGNPINAVMALSYQNVGLRANIKNMDSVYVEGYISSNTSLELVIKNDFGGSTSIQSFDILGTDSAIVFSTIADGSLGKNPFGKNPIGSITDSLNDIPKFRVIRQFVRQDSYEYQLTLQSNDIDQQWECLAIGDNAGMAGSLPTSITE